MCPESTPLRATTYGLECSACPNRTNWYRVYLRPWLPPFRWVWACGACMRQTREVDRG